MTDDRRSDIVDIEMAAQIAEVTGCAQFLPGIYSRM